jgi:hypothetical protein
MYMQIETTATGVLTQTKILGKINFFDEEPEWCLPPDFWDRSSALKGYTVFPLGSKVSFPIRQCHISALDVVTNWVAIGEKLEYGTGYAQYKEHWTRHSWVIHRNDMVLLEVTPNTFDQYFGVILTDTELEQFKEIIAYEG